MPSQFSKLWIQRAQNQTAIQRASQIIQGLGRALPCRVVNVSGAIVTVAFEIQPSPWPLPEITIPKAESPWIRMPTQVGDYGVTMPADVYLGGISGLGGGTADIATPANLSALVFVPVSNSGSPPVDQNAAQIQGPNGAIIQTTTGTTSSIVVNSSGITLTYGGKVVTLNASGFTIDGILFDTHVHGGVSPGGSNTTGPA